MYDEYVDYIDKIYDKMNDSDYYGISSVENPRYKSVITELIRMEG